MVLWQHNGVGAEQSDPRDLRAVLIIWLLIWWNEVKREWTYDRKEGKDYMWLQMKSDILGSNPG